MLLFSVSFNLPYCSIDGSDSLPNSRSKIKKIIYEGDFHVSNLLKRMKDRKYPNALFYEFGPFLCISSGGICPLFLRV